MSSDRSNNPWLYDLRLRDRNLRSGALDEKELVRHLGALKDLEAEVDHFSLAQPAIGSGVDEAPVSEEPADSEEPAAEASTAEATE